MLVSDYPLLVGYFHLDNGVLVQNDALATEPRLQPGIVGPVHEILFLVRDFLQEVVAALHVNMAGAASTNTAAVVVQVDVVRFRNLQNGRVNRDIIDRDWSNAFILESKFDGSHNFKKSAKVDFV